GLLVGLELVEDRASRAPANALGAAVTAECLRRGLSMNIARSGPHANCFRMAPPPTATEAEIDTASAILDSSIRSSLDKLPERAVVGHSHHEPVPERFGPARVQDALPTQLVGNPGCPSDAAEDLALAVDRAGATHLCEPGCVPASHPRRGTRRTIGRR